MKACPYCAEEIQDAAIYCRYCNHDLRQPVEPISAPPPMPPQVPSQMHSPPDNPPKPSALGKALRIGLVVGALGTATRSCLLVTAVAGGTTDQLGSAFWESFALSFAAWTIGGFILASIFTWRENR